MSTLPPDVHADFDVNARTVKVTIKPALEMHPIVVNLSFWYIKLMAVQILQYEAKAEQQQAKPSPILRPS